MNQCKICKAFIGKKSEYCKKHAKMGSSQDTKIIEKFKDKSIVKKKGKTGQLIFSNNLNLVDPDHKAYKTEKKLMKNKQKFRSFNSFR